MVNQTKTHCFHCALPIPENFSASLIVFEQQQYFCCLGCLAVAETIVENNLESYYQFRTKEAAKPEDIITEFSVFDKQEVQKEFVEVDKQISNIDLLSDTIHCSACAWLIERKLQRLDGVEIINVNVSQQLVHLSWNSEKIALSEILKQLREIGYPAMPFKNEQALELKERQNKQWLRKLGLAGLGMMQVMMFAVALYIGAFDSMDSQHRTFLRWVSFLVATPVLCYAASGFYNSAFSALKQFKLNMDVPIVLALSLAYFSSIWATFNASGEVYFDSVTMFVFFLLIGRYLEFRVRQKVTQKIYQKHEFGDFFVEKIIDLSSGETQTTAVTNIQVGDFLLVKPGAIFAFDSEVIEGSSMVNEAMLNGEFMPLEKNIGSKTLAGSINNHSPLVVRVTKTQEQGFINRLYQLQQRALGQKPQLSLLADRVARYFVVAIILLAIATYFYWFNQSPQDALWITISVLVVTCPCALSLATPVALTCGILSLNKRNILISEQNFLQRLAKITDIIFDKTGTLTQGQLSVQSVELISQQFTESQVLSLIAALETRSEHPIAEAFRAHLSPHMVASNLVYTQSAGVCGEVAFHQNLEKYYFGNFHFIQSQEIPTGAYDNNHGQNKLYLANSRGLIASLELNDQVRPDALEAISKLAKDGFKLHLLSGDPSDQVKNLADKLAINNWQNKQQPQQKIDYLQRLQRQSGKVLMIGDGINDAPVMAASDGSMAMLGASAFTKNNADSYLLSGKLSDISFATNKAKHIYAVIKQNLTWALLYNVIMIPFAVSGLIPPYLAAIGMSLSSIVVVVNSLRLTKEH